MSHSKNQQFLEPGQRVRLTRAIPGRVEDLSGVLRAHEMDEDTEVIILGRETKLEASATGEIEVPYYSFKKDIGDEWTHYEPGFDVGRSQLIPHKCLSETVGGPAKDDFYECDDLLFVIEPFDYKGEILTIHQGEKYRLERGDKVFVMSDGTDTAQGINHTTELSKAHYHFQKAIETKGPRIWTSNTYYSTVNFKVLALNPDEGKERKFRIR